MLLLVMIMLLFNLGFPINESQPALDCGCGEDHKCKNVLCIDNGSCYDEYGVRICDGVTCGCNCSLYSCGCECAACAQAGVCNGDKCGDACSCTHCSVSAAESGVLSCGCTDPDCVAHGSCGPNCTYACDGSCHFGLTSATPLSCGCTDPVCVMRGSCYSACKNCSNGSCHAAERASDILKSDVSLSDRIYAILAHFTSVTISETTGVQIEAKPSLITSLLVAMGKDVDIDALDEVAPDHQRRDPDVAPQEYQIHPPPRDPLQRRHPGALVSEKFHRTVTRIQ